MADRIDWEQHAATAQHDWSAAEQRKNDELTQLRAEVERLRTAGDALVDAVLLQRWSTVDVAVAAWLEARREQ